MTDDNVIDMEKYRKDIEEEIPPLGPYIFALVNDEETDTTRFEVTPAYDYMTPLYKRFLAKILVHQAFIILQEADEEEWGVSNDG